MGVAQAIFVAFVEGGAFASFQLEFYASWPQFLLDRYFDVVKFIYRDSTVSVESVDDESSCVVAFENLMCWFMVLGAYFGTVFNWWFMSLVLRAGNFVYPRDTLRPWTHRAFCYRLDIPHLFTIHSAST